jgi:hypothetical protein
MLGREVVERQQRFAILGQVIGGLIVFGFVLGNEAIEGFSGFIPREGLS